MGKTVDKINSDIARRMKGYPPHKMIKLGMQAYYKRLKQEEDAEEDAEEDVFDINKVDWLGLNNEQ